MGLAVRCVSVLFFSAWTWISSRLWLKDQLRNGVCKVWRPFYAKGCSEREAVAREAGPEGVKMKCSFRGSGLMLIWCAGRCGGRVVRLAGADIFNAVFCSRKKRTPHLNKHRARVLSSQLARHNAFCAMRS